MSLLNNVLVNARSLLLSSHYCITAWYILKTEHPFQEGDNAWSSWYARWTLRLIVSQVFITCYVDYQEIIDNLMITNV